MLLSLTAALVEIKVFKIGMKNNHEIFGRISSIANAELEVIKKTIENQMGAQKHPISEQGFRSIFFLNQTNLWHQRGLFLNEHN